MNDELSDVILLDEDGEQIHYEHVLTFLYEGVRYVALTPLGDESDPEDEEQPVVIYRIDSHGGEDVYCTVENEVLLAEVFDAFVELMEEQYEEDGEDGEE